MDFIGIIFKVSFYVAHKKMYFHGARRANEKCNTQKNYESIEISQECWRFALQRGHRHERSRNQGHLSNHNKRAQFVHNADASLTPVVRHPRGNRRRGNARVSSTAQPRGKSHAAAK